MTDVESVNVSLSADLAAALRAAVDDGEYRSVSEAVQDALRDWRLRRQASTSETEELRRLVQEGIDSGPGLDADDVFARMRARFGHPPAE